MKYNAICFDLDGVIINSEALHEAAFRETLKTYGLPLSSDDYINYFAGKTDQQGFIDYQVHLNTNFPLADLLTMKQRAYDGLAPNELQYYKGIPELIKKLYSAFPLALVTGSTPEEAILALNGRNLNQYFTTIVTANDVTDSKPSPESYLLAAKQLGESESVTPESCIVIEDSPTGILAAKQAGMLCIAVTTTHPPNLLQLADHIVDELSFDMLGRLAAGQS